MTVPNVIIVEDDPDLLGNLVEFLSLKGMNVAGLSTGAEFSDALASDAFQVAIVDIGLPDKDGFEIVAELRANTKIGIIVLTARSGIKDKLHGYDLGADIYLSKPVDMHELSAVTQNLARRMMPQPEAPQWKLADRRLLIQCPNGVEVCLNRKENAFLSLVMGNNGEPVARSRLMEATGYIDDADGYGNRAFDVMLVRLRKKLKDASGPACPIRTVHSLGYSFAEANECEQ